MSKAPFEQTLKVFQDKIVPLRTNSFQAKILSGQAVFRKNIFDFNENIQQLWRISDTQFLIVDNSIIKHYDFQHEKLISYFGNIDSSNFIESIEVSPSEKYILTKKLSINENSSRSLSVYDFQTGEIIFNSFFKKGVEEVLFFNDETILFIIEDKKVFNLLEFKFLEKINTGKKSTTFNKPISNLIKINDSKVAFIENSKKNYYF